MKQRILEISCDFCGETEHIHCNKAKKGLYHQGMNSYLRHKGWVLSKKGDFCCKQHYNDFCKNLQFNPFTGKTEIRKVLRNCVVPEIGKYIFEEITENAL